MAFIANDPNLDDEKKQDGQAPVLSGASSVINTQAFGNPNEKQRQDSSGRFVNLQNYLQTNQQQAGELGNKVAGKVEEKAEGFKSQLGQAQEKFGQKVDENRVIFNQQAVDEAVNDPTKFVQDADKVQQFAKMRDASYKGPSGLEDIEDYQGVQSQFDQANEYLTNSQSESGRNALLKDTFNRSSYTGGQSKLDQLLLQNDSGAREKFSEVQNKYSGLSDILNSSKTQAQEAQKLASEQTAEAKQKVWETVGREDDPTTPENEATGAIGNLRNSLQDRAAKQQAANQSLYSNATAQLSQSDRAYSQDVLDLLGLSAGSKLYDLNLGNYALNYNPDSINASSVQSKDEANRYAALNQLMGSIGTLDPNSAESASGVSFDAEKLKADLKNKEAIYNNLMGSELSGLSGAGQAFYDAKNFISSPTVQSVADVQRILNEVNAWNAGDASDYAKEQWNTEGQGGDLGVSYRQLRDWLSRYNSLRPNETVRVK